MVVAGPVLGPVLGPVAVVPRQSEMSLSGRLLSGEKSNLIRRELNLSSGDLTVSQKGHLTNWMAAVQLVELDLVH